MCFIDSNNFKCYVTMECMYIGYKLCHNFEMVNTSYKFVQFKYFVCAPSSPLDISKYASIRL